MHFTEYDKGVITLIICGKIDFLLVLKVRFLLCNKSKWNYKYHGFHCEHCYVMLGKVVAADSLSLTAQLRSARKCAHV